MHITQELIHHLTELALLELTPEEETRYAKELDGLIGYFEKLQEIDTSKVEPTYHAVPIRNVLRPDDVKKTFKIDDLIAVLPFHEEGAIKVPKIIDIP